MARREYKGAAPETTLSSGILAAGTSFTVADGTGYPTGATGSFFVVIDPGTASEEKILCLSRATNTFTCTGGRGADDTVAVDHAAGAKVRHVFTKTDADEANAHVNATTGVHGKTSALASLSDVETLTNKTMSGSANTFSAIPQSAVTALVTDLAAKVAKADVHDTWETALGTAPGANWPAALAATLDSDAATVLGAMGTGWPADLALASTAVFLRSRDVQVFTSSGTWTKPANAKLVRVRVVGGGGGGGGAVATNAGEVAAGAGGDAGGYSEELFAAAALGATETVTRGNGGSGVSGAAGGNGGTSSFGAHLSATGGAGGPVTAANSVTLTVPTSGTPAPGAGSGGTINYEGGSGSPGMGLPNGAIGGNGGNSALGGGGPGVSTAAGSQGTTGSAASANSGAGGGGAINRGSQSARAGGNGGAGVVIVETFV